MDQWLQKISLPVLILVAGLAFYGYSTEVSCWTPNHFTPTYDRYVDTLCSQPTTVRYELPEKYIPRNTTDLQFNSDVNENSTWLLKMVLFEMVLVCVVYALVRWLEAAGSYDARCPHEELHTSYVKVPLYFLLQAAAALCWLIVAVMSIKQTEPSEDKMFMCDFKVMRLGNVIRYTVQCIERGIKFTSAALMVNFSLALIATIVKAVHIVCTFFIGPFLRIKGARAALLEKKVIQNPSQLGAGFALSDLYFAYLAIGKQGLVSGAAKPNNESEMEMLTKTD